MGFCVLKGGSALWPLVYTMLARIVVNDHPYLSKHLGMDYFSSLDLPAEDGPEEGSCGCLLGSKSAGSAGGLNVCQMLTPVPDAD